MKSLLEITFATNSSVVVRTEVLHSEEVLSLGFLSAVAAAGNFVFRVFQVVVGLDQVAIVVVAIPSPKAAFLHVATHCLAISRCCNARDRTRNFSSDDVVPSEVAVFIVAVLNHN